MKWNPRTTYWEGDKGDKNRKPTDDAPSDPGDDDEPELTTEQLQRAHSYLPHVFGRLVLDEAQKIKSILTLTHKTLAALEAPYVNMLSATPMMNKPVDLVGFLAMLSKNADSELTVPTRADYVDAKRGFEVTGAIRAHNYLRRHLSISHLFHFSTLLKMANIPHQRPIEQTLNPKNWRNSRASVRLLLLSKHSWRCAAWPRH